MYLKKVKQLLAVSTVAIFVGGASAIQAQAPPIVIDTDGDGIEDAIDQCPTSDLSATVLINGVNTRNREYRSQSGWMYVC